MKQIVNVCLIIGAMFAVGYGVMILSVKSYAMESRIQNAKAECANSGHTWKQCNEFWISSGEYKRPSSEPDSKEWREFIKAR